MSKGIFAKPARTAHKSRPNRAPLSSLSSLQDSANLATHPTHPTPIEEHHRSVLRASASQQEQQQKADTRRGNIATSDLLADWRGKHSRKVRGQERRARMKMTSQLPWAALDAVSAKVSTSKVQAREKQNEQRPVRAAKVASQLKTKAVFQRSSSESDVDESATSQDIESSSWSSSSSSPSPSQRSEGASGTPSATDHVPTKAGSGNNKPESSLAHSTSTTSLPNKSKDKGKSKWSNPKYYTSAKKRRRRFFDKALNVNNLSVFRNTPQEFYDGVQGMQFEDDHDGEITTIGKGLMARHHVTKWAPNQAYKQAYFDHLEYADKQKDLERSAARVRNPRKKVHVSTESSQGKDRTTKLNDDSRGAHYARNERRWERTVSTIKRLEAKGLNFKAPIDEIEKSARNACLSDIDSSRCSRMINLYIKKARGREDWKALTKLKGRTHKRDSARRKAKIMR